MDSKCWLNLISSSTQSLWVHDLFSSESKYIFLPIVRQLKNYLEPHQYPGAQMLTNNYWYSFALIYWEAFFFDPKPRKILRPLLGESACLTYWLFSLESWDIGPEIPAIDRLGVGEHQHGGSIPHSRAGCAFRGITLHLCFTDCVSRLVPPLAGDLEGVGRIILKELFLSGVVWLQSQNCSRYSGNVSI